MHKQIIKHQCLIMKHNTQSYGDTHCFDDDSP